MSYSVEKYITFLMYLGFFCKYHREPKEYKYEALHSCNKLSMHLNSKFDELKSFYFKQFFKKSFSFLEFWELFSDVK